MRSIYFFVFYHRFFDQLVCVIGCPEYYKDIELIGFSDTVAGAKFIVWEEQQKRGIKV